MQIIIEEVVSRVRAMQGGASLSEDTVRDIVNAVVQAVEEKQRHHASLDEEHSLHNYQQRNQPWMR